MKTNWCTPLALAVLAAGGASAWGATPPALARQPKIPPAPKWSAPTPQSDTTRDGVQVVVLPEEQLPMVSVVLAVQAGSELDPADKPGLAWAVAEMLQDGGAGARSAPEVAQALADLGAELRVFVDPDGARLALTVLSRNLDRALALLGDLVARPRFDAAEWERAKQRRLAEIQRRRDEPAYISANVFARVLFGDHPYGHPPLGTPAAVASMTVQDLQRFYAAHYGPRTVGFVLVGDATPGAARASVERALAGWKSKAEPAASPIEPGIPLGGASREVPHFVVVDRPGAPQSEVRIGHIGRARKTGDFAALTLLETLLGGSFTSRLNQNLREKHGYTYGAHAQFQLWRAPGPFEAFAAVRSEVTAEAIVEFLAEIKAIRAPLGADELRKGRSLVGSSIVETFADGQRAAVELADLMLHDLPLDTWSSFGPSLDKLAAPSLTKIATQLFLPDRLTVVIVGDRKLIDKPLLALPFVKTIEYRDLDGNPLK
jgi:zinc protease